MKVFFNDNCVENLNAFIDSGSDLTIIGTKVAKKLKIKMPIIERQWTASNGDERQSPIIEINIQAEDDEKEIFLDEVLIDDGPLDEENNQEVALCHIFSVDGALKFMKLLNKLNFKVRKKT